METFAVHCGVYLVNKLAPEVLHTHTNIRHCYIAHCAKVFRIETDRNLKLKVFRYFFLLKVKKYFGHLGKLKQLLFLNITIALYGVLLISDPRKGFQKILCGGGKHWLKIMNIYTPNSLI